LGRLPGRAIPPAGLEIVFLQESYARHRACTQGICVRVEYLTFVLPLCNSTVEVGIAGDSPPRCGFPVEVELKPNCVLRGQIHGEYAVVPYGVNYGNAVDNTCPVTIVNAG